ncbi:hypothetical protein BC628DRAFT_1415448 [Trametes gibbosa]|nr:hypothetical protein BC628DRAFT_1415448 [Trametes gibbosa]
MVLPDHNKADTNPSGLQTTLRAKASKRPPRHVPPAWSLSFMQPQEYIVDASPRHTACTEHPTHPRPLLHCNRIMGNPTRTSPETLSRDALAAWYRDKAIAQARHAQFERCLQYFRQDAIAESKPSTQLPAQAQARNGFAESDDHSVAGDHSQNSEEDEPGWGWASTYAGHALDPDLKMLVDTMMARRIRLPEDIRVPGHSARPQQPSTSSPAQTTPQAVRKPITIRIPSISACTTKGMRREIREKESAGDQNDDDEDEECFEDVMREFSEAVGRHAEYNMWDIHDPNAFGPIGLLGEPHRSISRTG